VKNVLGFGSQYHKFIENRNSVQHLLQENLVVFFLFVNLEGREHDLHDLYVFVNEYFALIDDWYLEVIFFVE
jgi:hypothetical protein